MRSLFVALLFCTSIGAAAGPLSPESGCLDCFNFAAPSILGAETIASPEVGLIVLDTAVNKFRGYSSTGSWQTLTKEDLVVTKTSTYTATLNDNVILGNGTFTVTLPTASSATGKVLKFRNIAASNVLTVHGNSSELIDGFAAIVLNKKFDYLAIVSDGTGWHITESRMAPSVTQLLTPGTSTYTPPAGVRYLRVRMVGGGGGGSGSSTSTSAAGGTGGQTLFGTSLLVANGGAGGATNGPGGAGGSSSVSSPAVASVVLTGGRGGGVMSNVTASNLGGGGAASPFGGEGAGTGGTNNGAGYSAVANSGSGGGGGMTVGTYFAGGGGGAGGYVDAIIPSPGASYSYTVGGAGTAGSGGAGASAQAGGAGGSGAIIVEEFYQ